MKIFVVDNYDSFTYNLVQMLPPDVTVKRNDKFELAELADYDKILLSPGPGVPDQAGRLKEVIETYGATKSILGICLGHQAIAEVYGGQLTNLSKVYHGVSMNTIQVSQDAIFTGIDENFTTGRYHSWVVNKELSADLELLATDDEGKVMAIKHKTHDCYGFQFHPESILTSDGHQLINNWLNA